MWTPQHNFLDSSTKKMNFGKAISFTLSVDFAQLGNKMTQPSKQYQQKQKSAKNEQLSQTFNISNPFLRIFTLAFISLSISAPQLGQI